MQVSEKLRFLDAYKFKINKTYGHTLSSSSLLSTKLNSEVCVNTWICLEHCTNSSCPQSSDCTNDAQTMKKRENVFNGISS